MSRSQKGERGKTRKIREGSGPLPSVSLSPQRGHAVGPYLDGAEEYVVLVEETRTEVRVKATKYTSPLKVAPPGRRRRASRPHRRYLAAGPSTF